MLERHTKILNLLSEHKKIEVVKLSEILGVSQVTIRKDLARLESSGILTREHGYATLNSKDDINNRLAHDYNTKQLIARRAIQEINDGETIMIESGSCCALLALEIAKTKKDVTIITNSAFIAEYIRKVNSIKIILLGGEYQSESQVMVGPITKKCAAMFYVDKLFIGTDGFTEKTGFTGSDYMRAEAVRDMAKQADKVIIITDSKKFVHKSVVGLMDVSQIHAIVTDIGIPRKVEEYLQSKNITVVKVEK